MPANSTAPNPAPANPATSAKPRTPRGDIDQKHVVELEFAEFILRSAVKPTYATALATGGIDAAFLELWQTRISGARDIASEATQKTTSRVSVTGEEQKRQTALVELLKRVQARAKQKHADNNRAALRDYYIGDPQPLDVNRPRLEQSAESILKKLETDALPGITAATLTQIADALTSYKQVQSEQSSQQAGATEARQKLAEEIGAIAAARRKIQFAADAEWPHTRPVNAAIRREFRLPQDKSLKA